MKKVLHYVGKMDIGGIESLLMTLYRNIDRSEVQFDFAVHTEKKHLYDDEIMQMGGTFHRFPGMRENPIRYRRAWDRFWELHKDEYTAFHFHTPTFANLIAMKSAKRHGVPVIIAHCHNIHAARGRLQEIHDWVHKYHRERLDRYATHFFACSEPAAEWGFGSLYTEGKVQVQIMKNGIDLSRFTPDPEVRNRMRMQWNLTDKFVIGNVARLAAAKNQSFLLDVLVELKKRKENTVLVVVGDGPDQEMLTEKAYALGVEHDVLWLGAQSDVPPFLQMMDCFVFPSIYEGLGISLIEAQAIGLPTVTSKDRVPKEAKLTDCLEFLPLEDGAKAWAEAIVDMSKKEYPADHKAIIDAGYSMEDTVRKYQRFIMEANGLGRQENKWDNQE